MRLKTKSENLPLLVDRLAAWPVESVAVAAAAAAAARWCRDVAGEEEELDDIPSILWHCFSIAVRSELWMSAVERVLVPTWMSGRTVFNAPWLLSIPFLSAETATSLSLPDNCCVFIIMVSGNAAGPCLAAGKLLPFTSSLSPRCTIASGEVVRSS